jgi:hypothetical protein
MIRRQAPLLLLLALSPLGCGTVYTRGLVEDAAGAPLGGASVRLSRADGEAVAAASTDAHGCFFLQRSAPKGQRRFRLEIGAPGFKAARREVPLQPPVLLATLVDDSAPGESGIRETTATERAEKWDPRCIPLYAGGGAQELSPR